MGARQGAGAVYLNVLHPDFETLLDSKKINADEKIRLTTLSISLLSITLAIFNEPRLQLISCPQSLT